MKKFKFSLGKMRDYKEQILDREKNALLQLQMRKDRIDEKIGGLERELEQVAEELQAQARKGTTALEVKCFHFQMENMRRQLKQLRNEQKILAASVENQRKVVLSASQEVAGLDKLEEKQYEEYRSLQMKTEELVVSEYVSSQVIRQRAAGV